MNIRHGDLALIVVDKLPDGLKAAKTNVLMTGSGGKALGATPQDLFDKLNWEFGFTLDSCADSSNHKCSYYFDKKNNGLNLSWRGHIVFMNPPYGREIGKWVRKAYEEAQRGCLAVCLLPARTDTKWWHDYCMKGEIRFIKGRLKFGNSKNSAPFPSAIIIFKG